MQNKFRWFSNSSNSHSNINSDNSINDVNHRGDEKLKIPSNETSADQPNQPKKESLALKLDPRAIFPWHHSPHSLPRLVPNTEEFNAQGGYIGPHLPPLNGFMRGLAWVNAAGFLGAKIMTYGGWKTDMEDAFQLAFAASVQGVLHNVYTCKSVRGTLDVEHALDTDEDIAAVIDADTDTNIDTDSMDIDTDTDKTETDKTETDIDTDTDRDTDTDAKKSLKNKSRADTGEEFSSPTKEPPFPILFEHSINHEDDYQLKQALPENACHHMLEPHLVSLYRSAHTFGKHKLQIKLHSKPKSATMQSLFVLPFLTRKEVEDNVTLKHSYKNIVKAIQSKCVEKGRELNYLEIGNLVGEKLDDMSRAQMERREKKHNAHRDGDDHDHDHHGPIMQVTVVAQVSIQCEEIFMVTDTETGDVVQGDAEGNVNDVTHLVRFEIVVDMNAETGEIDIGNWQITDWDDLLDGNMFFSDYHIL